LIKEKGVLDAGAAALRVSGLELGGLLGSLVAGRISDWYIATSPGGAVGKRIQVVMAYMFGVAAMLLAFQAVPAGKYNHLQISFALLLYTRSPTYLTARLRRRLTREPPPSDSSQGIRSPSPSSCS